VVYTQVVYMGGIPWCVYTLLYTLGYTLGIHPPPTVYHVLHSVSAVSSSEALGSVR